MLVAQKVIEDDRWLLVQRVMGQVTRGRCGDGSGVMIEKRSGALGRDPIGIEAGPSSGACGCD